jgi:hypothetical protein
MAENETPTPQRRSEWSRKAQTTTVALYPGDKELLAWAADFMGCSRSEVIRSAVRAYVMHLEMVTREHKPGRKP